MSGVRASFQLARALETSMGPDRLLLKAMQWATQAQARVCATPNSSLERLNPLQGVICPPQHRVTIVIGALAPATQYQAHAGILT